MQVYMQKGKQIAVHESSLCVEGLNSVVQNRQASEDIYEQIKRDIIELKLRPGEFVQVEGLAKRVNASRTPVREAVARLIHEGLLERLPGRKLKVSEITITDIEEIYQVREAIEGLACQMAAPNVIGPVAERLTACIQRLLQAESRSDFDTCFVEDAQFHGIILEIAGNRQFQHIIGHLDARVHRLRYAGLGVESRLLKWNQEHLEIFERLIARDPKGAREAMEIHLRSAREDFRSFIDHKGIERFTLAWVTSELPR